MKEKLDEEAQADLQKILSASQRAILDSIDDIPDRPALDFGYTVSELAEQITCSHESARTKLQKARREGKLESRKMRLADRTMTLVYYPKGMWPE
jgi:hypothetical protein